MKRKTTGTINTKAFNFNLGAGDQERIKRIRKRTESSTDNEALRRAIRFYDDILTEVSNGVKISATMPDGETVHYRILIEPPSKPC